MNLSAKIEYACVAVLQLAASYGTGEPVRIRHIAETHGIPSRFLVQILLQLKSAGLVASTRGAAGGYQLIVDPETISVADVMEVFDCHLSAPVSSSDVETPGSRALMDVWREAAELQRRHLRSVSFADLLERAGGSQNMYYI